MSGSSEDAMVTDQRGGKNENAGNCFLIRSQNKELITSVVFEVL